MNLSWTPDDQPASQPGSDPALLTALSEQLGLRIVSTRAPVPVLVIDRIEKPTPN